MSYTFNSGSADDGSIVRVNCPSRIVNGMLTDNDLFQLISHSKGASLLRQVGEVIQTRHGLENMFDAEEVRKSKVLFETLGAEL